MARDKKEKAEYNKWYETTEKAKCARRKYNKTPERAAELKRRLVIYRKPKYNENHYKKWSYEECQILISSNASVTELANYFGRSVPAIIRKRAKLLNEE